MSAYDITIRVLDEEKLADAISAIASSGTIRSLVPVIHGHATKKRMAYANNKRNKGILGKDLLLSLFKKKASWTNAEIVRAFVAAGFSPNSASPRIAYLKKEGGIKQTGVHTYILASRAK